MPATISRRSGSSMTQTSPNVQVEVPGPVTVKRIRRTGPKEVVIKVEHKANVVKDEVIDTPAPGTEVPVTSRRGRGKKAAAIKAEVDVEKDAVEVPSAEPAPAARKRRRAAQKPAIVEEDAEDQDDSKSMVASPGPSEKSEADGSVELDSDGEPVRRNKNGRKIGKRKKKTKEPIVYVIPDVPKRDFRLEGPIEKRQERRDGFKGRLGYACLNTVLRNQDPPVFCSRNVRIKTIEEKGLGWVKDLAIQNVKDIIPMLEFNAANNIHMMRLSSEIFPFASHEKYGYDISFASKELAEAGEAAKRLKQRLTMHPGQFCVLSTPRENVLKASVAELEVHAKVLDLMGVGPDGVMILHGGGTYGDREASLVRIKHAIENRLPDFVRRRLVLENDEMSYSAEELLPLCESLDPPVPFIFDFHHDLLRPSSISPEEIIKRAQVIFARRGITPKYHLSEPRPGARTLMERRAHSDRCVELPPNLPADADLMLECKDKEQGVLEMYRIYDLYPVIHDNLRPPADDLTTATGGRKSRLDGSGGTSGRARSSSPNSTSAADAPPKPTAKQTEASLVERAIEKAKAAAAKRGVKYDGPLTQKEREAARGPIMSAAEVKEDMQLKAEWIRKELREGRERRPFPGTGEEETAIKEEPEPDAY